MLMGNYSNKSYGFFLDNDSSRVAIREQEEKNNAYARKIFEQQQASKRRQAALEKFTSESRDFLLTESLYWLYKKCLPENISESLLNSGRSVIHSFVQEEGSVKLLNSFTTKTFFLSELASIVESAHRQVLHDCEEKNDPFSISQSTFKGFQKDLDTLNTDQITKAIAQRVTMAEEKMVADNIKDKQTMEKLASKTQEKIDKVKANNDETEKGIKQEYTALYRQSINNQVISRRKSILESIVSNMATQVATKNILEFTKSNGKLDMDKIIETSEVMYGVLEMLNTIKAKNFTPEYINEVVSNIQ